MAIILFSGDLKGYFLFLCGNLTIWIRSGTIFGQKPCYNVRL